MNTDQQLWHVWLTQEAANQGFTKAQIHRAKTVCQEIPRIFSDVPSAMRDADDNLCLTWEGGRSTRMGKKIGGRIIL